LAKILLADDSTHAQRMGAKILTAEGYEVSTVSNGQAAIQAIGKAAPELVIADVFMPGKNGYEVCHFIKTAAKLKNIPVLLIIGAMEPYDPEEGRRAGADGVITKPLESSNLLATVKAMLAAAKRFAPVRAVPSETASGKVVIDQAAAAVQETPQWEDTPEEIITSSIADKLEIPQEISQQAIGMLSDFMGADEPVANPEFSIQPAESAVMDAVPAEAMATAMGTEEPPAPKMTKPDGLLPDPGTLPQHDIAEKVIWTAEAAEMTEEEAKLFEQPSANWRDLEQLVEQKAAEPPPLPWQTPSPPERDPALESNDSNDSDDSPVEPDRLLYVPEDVDAPTSSDPGIEHYDTLDAVVGAQGPVAYKADPAPAETPAGTEESPVSPEFAGPVEELEASPSERDFPPLDQLVRRAVEDLMPEIIDRVKQSLKN